MGSFTFDPGGDTAPVGARPFWRRRRNRHGRGLRGSLLLPQIPGARTRQQRFEDLVAESGLRLEKLHPARLADVKFMVTFAPERTTLDRAEARAAGVPLGRSVRYKPTRKEADAGPDGATSGREEIVIYRRPVEQLSPSPVELPDVVHDVLIELVAELLNLDPYDVDSSYGRSNLRGH